MRRKHRKKFPKKLAIRIKLAQYLTNKDYTMFDICVLLGYSLRDYQKQVHGPFLSSENRRLINDDEYREEVVNALVQKLQQKTEYSLYTSKPKGEGT